MKFVNVIKREYLKIFKDPGAFLILVIAVFIYPIIYAIPYAPEVLDDMPIGVVDFDNTSTSRDFVRKVNVNSGVEIVSRPLSVDEAKREFYEDKIKGYFIVPKDFERNLMRGEKSQIALYTDSAYLIVYKQVTTAVQSAGLVLTTKLEAGKLVKKGMDKNKAKAAVMPFEFVSNPLYNPSSGYASYIYPLVLILILQQTFLVGVGMIGGTERERKEDLKYINRTILAKTFCYSSLYFIYGFLYLTFLPAVLSYGFHFNLTMFLILALFLFAISFMAQSLVFLFKTREYSIITLAVFGLPFLFFPGFVWPKEAMPFWINSLARFIPSTSAIDAFVKLNQMGASFNQVKEDFYILILLCFFYYILAYLSLRRLKFELHNN